MNVAVYNQAIGNGRLPLGRRYSLIFVEIQSCILYRVRCSEPYRTYLDGCHINSLLLTLFYKYLPQLFNEGRIFVADVPELYAQYKDNLVMGDTLSEVQAKLQKLKAPKTTPIHHIKGWGEIDASLMDVLAVNPETRKLIQIKPIEHRDTVEFVACMNDDVAFRRKMLNLPE